MGLPAMKIIFKNPKNLDFTNISNDLRENNKQSMNYYNVDDNPLFLSGNISSRLEFLHLRSVYWLLYIRVSTGYDFYLLER